MLLICLFENMEENDKSTLAYPECCTLIWSSMPADLSNQTVQFCMQVVNFLNKIFSALTALSDDNLAGPLSSSSISALEADAAGSEWEPWKVGLDIVCLCGSRGVSVEKPSAWAIVFQVFLTI